MRSSDGNRSLGKAFRPSAHGENPMDDRLRHPAERKERKTRLDLYVKEMEEQGQFTYRPMKGDGQSA
jgi:hypothetical protein